MTRVLRLGTRGSALARTQAGIVANLLDEAGWPVQLVTVVTAGDTRLPDTAWGEGAFVGALETALREGSIDVAVHSAKDVPIEPEEDLRIAAYPVRADARDALVSRTGHALEDLPAGSRIGTDSPRRTGFLLAARPDVRVVPLHGNVDSRLRRLDAGEVDALVLAVAGLERLGRGDRIAQVLPPELVPPAPGQGALSVQVRAGDDLVTAVEAIDAPAVRAAVTAERAVLEAHGGGCRAPLGAYAAYGAAHALELTAGVVGVDGRDRRVVHETLHPLDAAELPVAARAIGDALRARRSALA